MKAKNPPVAAAADGDIGRFCGGTAFDCWRWLGAHPAAQDGQAGFQFAVWAPAAQRVGVIGEWNQWQPEPLQQRGPIWHGFCASAAAGQLYKFAVTDCHGHTSDRADPFAFEAELRPGAASRLRAGGSYRWRDTAWRKQRAQRQAADQPLSIYEIHLGSWRKWEDRCLSYRDLAEKLIAHVSKLGFTHVEFLPPLEHPYDPSWGYQVTGYFAATSRYGTPDDFRYLVDQLHGAGIGVLIDWVPAHFPRDAHALWRFDGTPQFEHGNPQRGEHPDWGTAIFDFGKYEVKSFLLASAHFWLHEMHVDGLRVDAVASMLYLDYSRGPGQWTPNENGGNWNLQAIEFLRDLNAMIRAEFPGALCIAEESTAFPGVTQPVQEGGLGFHFKWNMGWMHDVLGYLATDPIERKWRHDQVTFSLTYAFAERFLLPLSHDEVVHGKRSLVGKMGGRTEHSIDQLRLLYACQWLHPGKKLLFMGQEFAATAEWNQDGQLDWHASGGVRQQGLLRWVAELNRLYRSEPALHATDCDKAGFAWVEGNNRDESILVWQRGAGLQALVVVLHFTPVDRRAHWVPLPELGRWRYVAHSGLGDYGGDRPVLPADTFAVENFGRICAQLDVGPFAALVLRRAEGL